MPPASQQPTSPAARQDAFLRAFFSPPNSAVLSADGAAWTVLGKPLPTAQSDFLAQCASRVRSGAPALLPWIQSDATTWYAIAFEPLQVRILQQWLRAFVGRTFGSFSELPIALRSQSAPESLLRSLSPAAVFSIEAVGSARKPVRDQIARLLRLLAERPDLSRESWDTSSSLLRSFFAALAARNLHLATEAFSRLKSGSFLDAVNLAFLEIQLLAAREEWSAIADADRLSGILPLRRPLRIDSLVAAALYRTRLAGQESQPAAMLDAFVAKVLPIAGAIFSRQFPADPPEAHRCYLLWRLSSSKDPALIASAASGLPAGDPLRQFADQRVAALAPQTPPPTIDHARTCSGAGDWQGVVQDVEHLPPSAEVLGLAIRAAAEIGTAAAAQFASAQWSRHAQAHQEAILRSRWFAGMWKAVSDLCNEHEPAFTPSSPGGWFSRLAADPGWPQALAAWDRGIGEWNLKTFALSSSQVEAATRLLAAPPAEARPTLRQALPQLLGQLPEEVRASHHLQKFHLHSAEFLATTDVLSEEERELMVEASLRALDTVLAPEEYSYLVEQCFTDAWQRTSSPRTFPWALSLLEILADRPTAQPAVRASFAQLVFADAQRYMARLAPSQTLLLRELLKVISLDELAHVLPQALPPQAQAGEVQQLSSIGIRRVGIYTLMVSAARRAQAIIQAAHPSIDVVLNADHVATAALRNMARDCDALLIATSSAKHAATTYLEQNHRGQLLLYVNGKGSSSLLSAWNILLEQLSAP